MALRSEAGQDPAGLNRLRNTCNLLPLAPLRAKRTSHPVIILGSLTRLTAPPGARPAGINRATRALLAEGPQGLAEPLINYVLSRGNINRPSIKAASPAETDAGFDAGAARRPLSGPFLEPPGVRGIFACTSSHAKGK